MSLINDQLKAKADTQKPQIKPIQAVAVTTKKQTSPLPVVEPTPVPEELKQLPTLSPIQATVEETNHPEAFVEPPSESPQIGQVAPITPIFNEPELSPYSPAVVQNQLPTFYQTQPNFIGRQKQGQALVESAALRYNQTLQQQLTEAKKLEQATSERGRNPNQNDIDKPWFSAPQLGWASDILFGNQAAQKRTNEGFVEGFNPLAGEFGRAGAGLGGLTKYVLQTGGSAVLGAAAEVRKATANGLEAVGVDRNTAEAFSSDGFLGLLSKDFGFNIPFTGGESGVAYDSNGNLIRTQNTPPAKFSTQWLNKLKPSGFVGFNWEEARKRNLIAEAILGEDIADINDPKESTEVTGRVFFSPNRKLGDAWWKDPVGASLQVGLYFTNPGDIPVENVINAGVQRMFGRTSKKAVEVASELANEPYVNRPRLGEGQQRVYQAKFVDSPTPSSPSSSLTVSNQPELNPPRVDFGQAYVVSPELPAAANPTKVVRVVNGSSNVNQRLLPPSIEPELVPPSTSVRVLPASNPGLTAISVGIGKPSLTPIIDLGALDIRPYEQVVDQIALTNPKLLEGYKGITWADLKTHLSQQPNLNLQEFSVVGKKLLPAATIEKINDLNSVIEEANKAGDLLISENDYQFKGGGDPSIGARLSSAARVLKTGDNVAILNELNNGNGIVPYLNINYDDLTKPDGSIFPYNITKLRDILIQANVDSLTKEFLSQQKKIVPFYTYTENPPNIIKRLYEKAGWEWGGSSWRPARVKKAVPNEVKLTDKVEAIHELVSQKLAIEAPLRQLDELFDTSVDFGRRANSIMSPTEAKTTYVNRDAIPSVALTQAPVELYHGTKLEGWTPKYNLSTQGSRGELGYGLYLTKDKPIAYLYSQSASNPNANPTTLDFNINPSVHTLNSDLLTTLDARAKILSSSKLWQDLVFGLPEPLVRALKKANSRKKTLTYEGFLTKVESSLVKAGLEPTEETLIEVQKTIVNNLRQLGYDSVYDSKSGFTLVLDETKVKSISVEATPPSTLDESIAASYNVSAYAAKFYPDRLTTDSDLRDDTYKLLTKLRDNVETKVGELQQDIMKTKAEEPINGVLRKQPSKNDTKPKSAQELKYELPEEDICNL